MRACAPMPLPVGFPALGIHTLTGHLLHKHSGAGAMLGAGEGTLPGAHAPTIQTIHDPDRIPSAADRVDELTAHATVAMRRAVDRAVAVLREEPDNVEAA
jgi:hypothetical protein